MSEQIYLVVPANDDTTIYESYMTGKMKASLYTTTNDTDVIKRLKEKNDKGNNTWRVFLFPSLVEIEKAMIGWKMKE